MYPMHRFGQRAIPIKHFRGTEEIRADFATELQNLRLQNAPRPRYLDLIARIRAAGFIPDAESIERSLPQFGVGPAIKHFEHGPRPPVVIAHVALYVPPPVNSRAPLHASPTESAPVVSSYTDGTVLQLVDGRSPDWWEVVGPDGIHGFLRARSYGGAPYLRVLPEATAAPTAGPLPGAQAPLGGFGNPAGPATLPAHTIHRMNKDVLARDPAGQDHYFTRGTAVRILGGAILPQPTTMSAADLALAALVPGGFLFAGDTPAPRAGYLIEALEGPIRGARGTVDVTAVT